MPGLFFGDEIWRKVSPGHRAGTHTFMCACLSGARDLRVYSMAKIKNINSLFHIEEKSDNILRYEKIAAGHTNV